MRETQTSCVASRPARPWAFPRVLARLCLSSFVPSPHLSSGGAGTKVISVLLEFRSAYHAQGPYPFARGLGPACSPTKLENISLARRCTFSPVLLPSETQAMVWAFFFTIHSAGVLIFHSEVSCGRRLTGSSDLTYGSDSLFSLSM